jgi:hypothetical protein
MQDLENLQLVLLVSLCHKLWLGVPTASPASERARTYFMAEKSDSKES